uniref:Dynein light chain Tctex-type family member 5 n=1 Tax=Anolis carolinensis TaxID=28377 RepID=A0A803TEB1_ANOCA
MGSVLEMLICGQLEKKPCIWYPCLSRPCILPQKSWSFTRLLFLILLLSIINNTVIVGDYFSSISTVSYMDAPGHYEDILRPAVQMENTYRLGPAKCFPVGTVNNILKDVLTSYLQEEKYEAELCRQMTKTISEVTKARIKDLMIPRYKIIVIINIGQLKKQSIQIGSRCLWDTTNDTFCSYSFKNRSLFALANVYAVYSE